MDVSGTVVVGADEETRQEATENERAETKKVCHHGPDFSHAALRQKHCAETEVLSLHTKQSFALESRFSCSQVQPMFKSPTFSIQPYPAAESAAQAMCPPFCVFGSIRSRNSGNFPPSPSSNEVPFSSASPKPLAKDLAGLGISQRSR